MADKKHRTQKKLPTAKQNELRDYLRNNLSEKLSHDLNNAENDDFLKDAREGLQSFSSVSKINKHTTQLNKTLHKSIAGRRKSHVIRFSEIGWYVLAVVIVILLILLAFVVIWLSR
jgi:hypothetical protein